MSRYVAIRVAVLSLCALGQGSLAVLAEPVDFNRDIRPILSNNCFKCHGPDAKERQGGVDGLRLDTPEGAVADLGGGYGAIVPGNPDESELLRRVTTEDPDELMPPAASGKHLSAREIQLLRDWIQQGARYARHWSYVVPTRPSLPAVQAGNWPKNPIDYFLLARLEREGLHPTEEADRYALIRRLSLDLTGLPPTIEEADQFVQDKSPDAYEQLVDRLMKKSAFGEHWARMWLDLARYADSAGYADDPLRTIWAYRDYVIRSFNDNKPFDQFTVEQLAGDLLANPTEDQLIATAFHRNTLTNSEGGTNDEEFRNVAIVDRVNTTWATWMGTSMACAQCHSHKYDPLSQVEFFQFFAILNNSEDADRRDEAPLLEFYSTEQQRSRAEIQQQIAALEKTLGTSTPELAESLSRWESSFPKDLTWSSLRPDQFTSQAGAEITLQEDNSLLVGQKKKTDVYTLSLPLAQPRLTALRLELLPDDSLPAKGPGHAAGGEFVVSRVLASVAPPAATPLAGRYVRIDIPGQKQILSLAEVQIMSGAENIARGATATQSSTDFGGPPERAIDGNTSGKYSEGNSVTHTAISDNPWWEADLKTARPIDRLVIWNRTDPGTEQRLANFHVVVLDEQRRIVWEQTVKEHPQPSAELSTSNVRPLTFSAAYASSTESGFDPAHVITNPDVKTKGWSAARASGQPQSLTLVVAAPVDVPAGSTLSVTVEQLYAKGNHTVGRMRLAVTEDDRVAAFAATPADMLAILNLAEQQRSDEQRNALRTYYFTQRAPELNETRTKLAAARKQLAGIKPSTVPIMRELAGDKRRVTHLQFRGNFLDLGEEVSPGLPAAFPALPPGTQVDRLAMARWLVDPRNPLASRVIANRFWEQLFGIGLVRTSEEFGAQGELPSHPELLDWLAVELVESGWDIKHFVKLLVTTAAYRQSSRVTPELVERDPENRLLARGPRFRLSAEMVRDQALAASGLLSTTMYGPSVKPPQPALGLNAAFGSTIDWKTSEGSDRYRRGLYTEWRRSNPYPSMITFDAPNREVCTLRRNRTNTPLQALVTLNDPVYVECAQALARRMVQAGGAPAERATHGFRRCLARPPYEAELSRLVGLYEQAHAAYVQSPQEALQMATQPLGDLPAGMDAAEVAAWTVVANVLLNLDETLMKR